MAFKTLLNHRCNLYDLRSVDNDGSPTFSYVKVNEVPLRCRIDLSFIRRGKDTMWVETVARPEDRTGVMFFLPGAPIKAGMRVEIVRGPKGIFSLQGSIDEAWDFNSLSHLEVGVMEVSTLQYRAPVSQDGMDF